MWCCVGRTKQFCIKMMRQFGLRSALSSKGLGLRDSFLMQGCHGTCEQPSYPASVPQLTISVVPCYETTLCCDIASLAMHPLGLKAVNILCVGSYHRICVTGFAMIRWSRISSCTPWRSCYPGSSCLIQPMCCTVPSTYHACLGVSGLPCQKCLAIFHCS